MAVQAGTAYVDIKGDFSALNSQIDAALAPISSKFQGKFGKIGMAAAAGLAGVGVAAAAAGKALYDIGEQFDSAYDTIQVGTGATGRELDELKQSFRDVVSAVPADFGDAADAITQLNQRLGVTGKPLERISKQMLELSRITETDLTDNIEAVTRTFGDWGIKVAAQPKFLDKMFRASQATGISVADLGQQMVRYGAPLRQMGFGFSEAAAMVGKFEKEGVNAQLVMGSLRIALGKMASEGIKDPSKALGVLTQQIKNAGSAGEANKLAIETFGARAGPDMAAAIREGRFEFGSLVKEIDKGKSTIIGTGKSTQDFGERFKLLKNQVFVLLEPIATRVFNAIGEGMRQVTQLMKGKGGLHDTLIGIREDIRPVLDILGFMWQTAKVTLAGFAQAFKGAFDVIRGLVLVFTGLLKGDFGQMWNGIKLIFKGSLNVVKGHLKAATAPMRMVAGKLGDVIVGGFNVVKGIPGKIKGWLSGAANAVADFATSFYNKAKQVGQKIVDGIVNTVKKLPGAIKSAFGSLGGLAGDIGRMIADWLNDNTPFGDTIHINLPGPKDVDIHLPSLATGTRFFEGGPVLVGEEGPELAYLPRGTAVDDARTTRAILSGRSGGAATVADGRGHVEMNVYTEGTGNPDPNVFFAQFNAFARTRGLV